MIDWIGPLKEFRMDSTQLSAVGILMLLLFDRALKFIRYARNGQSGVPSESDALRETLDVLNRNIEAQTGVLQNLSVKIERIDVKVDGLAQRRN